MRKVLFAVAVCGVLSVAVVEEMDAHGVCRQADTTYADGHVTVPGNWPCCGVRVFRLTDKKGL